jgi:3-hydroxybutyryl-CoA dehydrogenase
MREIKTIGIIGEGKMGTNLFYYLLDFGFSIIWVCSKDAETEKIIKSFNKKLKRSLDAGIMEETSCSNIKFNTIITNDLQQLQKCELIIEAVSEDFPIKKKLFEELDRIINENCIFASNSSSIKPSELLESESRKDKLVGLHFFYPVALKNIVEFIVTDFTSIEIVKKIDHFLKIIKRNHLHLNENDSFILNKIYLDFQNEAFHIVNEGKLTIAQMDSLVKNYLFPAGVFDFCDSVGNDIMLTSVSNYIRDYTDKDHYLLFVNELERLVKANQLGIKSNAGFYTYPVEDQQEDILVSMKQELIDTSVKRLRSTLASSIKEFSSRSGIDMIILNNVMKEYLGTDKNLVIYLK